jgi:hypothetical protein
MGTPEKGRIFSISLYTLGNFSECLEIGCMEPPKRMGLALPFVNLNHAHSTMLLKVLVFVKLFLRYFGRIIILEKIILSNLRADHFILK